MSLKFYLLITIVIFCSLFSIASALVVNNTLHWYTTKNIESLSGGYLQVDTGGAVYAHARLNINRVNSSTPGRLIMNGGTMLSMDDFKFPDNYGPVEMWVNSGTFTGKKIQNLGGNPPPDFHYPGTIYVGDGDLTVYNYYSRNPGYQAERNPAAWEANGSLKPAPGYMLLHKDYYNDGQGTQVFWGKVTITGSKMSPESGTEDVFVHEKLIWAAPAGVTNPVYDVFLGTDQNAVANAVRPAGDFEGNRNVNSVDLSYLTSWWLQDPSGSVPYVNLTDDDIVNLLDFSLLAGNWQQPASAEYKGGQSAITFDPGQLETNTQYYWRVDVIDGSNTTTGNIWSFKTTPHDIEHVTACGPAGRYSGWPANYGAWNWGNEILVYIPQDDYLEQAGHNTGPNGAHYLGRSLDGGQTWSTKLWANVTINYPGQYVPINFTHPDFALKVWHDEEETFIYSYDRAQTWNGGESGRRRSFGPELLNAPELSGLKISSRTDYIVNGQYECFVFMSAEPPTDGGPETASRSDVVFMAKTTNGGITFEFVSWVVPPTDPYRGVMPSTVRCSPTKLVTAIRRRQWPSDINWIDAYVSNNNGNSWSYLSRVAEKSNIDGTHGVGSRNGNPPALIRLDDGRLCCTYGNRSTNKMIARFSHDEGATWDDEIVLRDDYFPDKYDIDGGDLGYPRIIRRPDGKLVTLYYWQTKDQYEQRTTAIEATIFQVD